MTYFLKITCVNTLAARPNSEAQLCCRIGTGSFSMTVECDFLSSGQSVALQLNTGAATCVSALMICLCDA